MEVNKIICGDCLDIMRDMPDNSVDLVLTDPPYGIGIDGQKGCICKNPKHDRKQHAFGGWDSKIPPPEVFVRLDIIGVNQIIWGGNYFVKHLKRGKKGWIVWDKGQYGLTMSDGELAYTSFDKPLRIVKYNRCELKKDGTQHPTQKPLALMTWILERYSKPNDLIFDPFCGSGTTCVAAKRLGRRYIGVDISPEYCDIARKRLEAEERGITVKELDKGQGSLFNAAT